MGRGSKVSDIITFKSMRGRLLGVEYEEMDETGLGIGRDSVGEQS